MITIIRGMEPIVSKQKKADSIIRHDSELVTGFMSGDIGKITEMNSYKKSNEQYIIIYPAKKSIPMKMMYLAENIIDLGECKFQLDDHIFICRGGVAE